MNDQDLKYSDRCRVNGLLECPEADECLEARRVYLPGYSITLTLKHSYDDQYIGIMDNGMQFIRESGDNFRHYLVA